MVIQTNFDMRYAISVFHCYSVNEHSATRIRASGNVVVQLYSEVLPFVNRSLPVLIIIGFWLYW